MNIIAENVVDAIDDDAAVGFAGSDAIGGVAFAVFVDVGVCVQGVGVSHVCVSF